MADIMRPVPFEELLHRMFGELRQSNSIFGIHQDHFSLPQKEKEITIFNQKCLTPVGPAAGPHTQLAQNIISSYLCGGRFIELKTVQQLDTLEIEKPCIDAKDEAYNTEWSSEYTLPKAFDEYLKGWIILHLLDSLFSNSFSPSFIFNMSVGYDLEGIKTPKMQTFIDSMLDATNSVLFEEYLSSLKVILAEGRLLEGTMWENKEEQIIPLIAKISPAITNSVTISTMHGCPPDEIEAICRYMLTEKKIHTYVKLNPTLLGYQRVRETLDHLGFDYIGLTQKTFDDDLQLSSALEMLTTLIALGRENKLEFGVKLTNTLASLNNQKELAGEEMYMSGRALFPLSVGVATLLSDHFKGELPISYCGGASAGTILELFECGIRPITVATDLLKPGGYIRLKQMVEILQSEATAWNSSTIDLGKLKKLEKASLEREFFKKEYRGDEKVSVVGKLPLTDCYVAPCVEACPIRQDVPEYIYLVGQGLYADALEVIYENNALPNLTGYICDHQCQYHCTRLDYEGTVQIREMKKIAAEEGFSEYLQRWEKPEKSSVKAAVIGAGPAGLSAAYFLARSQFDVTVFEREKDAGGITRYVIPDFRFPDSALQADIDFIAQHGVNFIFSADPATLTVDALKKEGYSHLFYAIGAEVDNEIAVRGDRSRIRASLSFLSAFRRDPTSLTLGKDVVVVGGGNTAMDGARAAMRVKGVESVTLLYRRGEKEMPADKEEYNNAIKDGVKFIFLSQPEFYDEKGALTCTVMELGEVDASGRRSPQATDQTFTIQADTLITAIGEKADSKALSWFSIPLDEKGALIADKESGATSVEGVYVIGDTLTGPSTIARCIASAQKAVDSALDQILGEEEDEHSHIDEISLEELEKMENAFFGEIREKKGRFLPQASQSLSRSEFATIEAARCLECNYICDKCVEVCPNRANVAIDMRHRDDLFHNPFQIVHLDAYCNECGNCTTFCPWEGSPYKDKLTLFSRLDDFENSTNNGFFIQDGEITLRVNREVNTHTLSSNGELEGEGDERIFSIIEEIIASHSYLLGAVGE